MEPLKEPISVRVARINSEITGREKGLAKTASLDRDTILDALQVLYDECCSENLQKLDVNVAEFVKKYKNAMKETKALRVNISDFEIKNIIGCGHFGEVYVVKEKQTGYVYAMKTIRKFDNETTVMNFEGERDIMAFSNSPWLARLQYSFQDSSYLFFVMDYHPGGDLLGLLHRKGGTLPESAALFYIAELILALEDLHCMGYVHRDVKPGNILIDRCGHIKLADFGSAAKLDKNGLVKGALPVGTPDYIAPEVLQCLDNKSERGAGYGVSSDFWSLGVLAYKLTMGNPPFQGQNCADVYSKIINYPNNLKFPPDISLSQAYVNFIKNLITGVKSRLKPDKIKSHVLFEGINFDTLRDKVPPYVPKINSVEDTSNFADVQAKKKTPSIDNFKKRSQFSGRNLPFIGFTFTHDPQGTLEPNFQRRSSQKSEVVENLKAEVESLRMTVSKSGDSNQENVNLKKKLEEHSIRLQGIESHRDKLEKQLADTIAECTAVKRTLETERKERTNLEKGVLDLIKGGKLKLELAEENKVEALDLEIKQLKAKIEQQQLNNTNQMLDELLQDALNMGEKNSSTNQIEDEYTIEVVSDEGDSEDVISSIIMSTDEPVLDYQDYCKSSAEATSPMSSTSFVEHGTNTETAMDLDNREYHNGSPIWNKEYIENDKETISSSYFVGEEAELETAIDLDPSENHSILSPNSEKEDEDSDKENSTAATMPISCSSLVGQRANTAMDFDNSEYRSNKVHEESDRENEENYKEIPTAANFSISSSSLVRQEADLDKCENYSIYSSKSEREDEESDKENSTTATLPILFGSLVEQEANTATAIDMDSSKSHNECLIKEEEDEQIDKGNSTAIISPSSTSSVGYDSDMETVVDSPVVSIDKEDEENDTENSTGVFKNPVNSTDELCENQDESSSQFEGTGCDTSTNSQNYQQKPVISDRRTFKCKLCSYSSTIRFALKRHMVNHSEDLDLNKMQIRTHAVSNRSIYRCTRCDYNSTKQSLLTRHMMLVHKTKFEGASLSTEAQQLKSCNFCSYTPKQNGHLMSLRQQLHTLRNKPIISCTKCDYKASRLTLVQHSSQKQKREYTCKFCSFTTHVERNLRTHTSLHTVQNRPIYCCPKCDYKSTKQDLVQHVKAIHKIQLKVSSLSLAVQLLRSTTDTFPISSGSLGDLETEIDLNKCENHSILSLVTDREGEENGKENSVAATLPISFSSLVGPEVDTTTAIDFDSTKSHNVSLIKVFEDEQIDKGNWTAIISPSSAPSVGYDSDMETVVNSDNGENPIVSSVSSDNKEDVEIDQGNSIAVTLPISTRSAANAVTAMDSDNSESRSKFPLTDKEDGKSEKQNSSAVVKNPIKSTDESSESQGETSRKFEAKSCNISTHSQKYPDKPVISDHATFKCEVCSYSSTIRLRLKKHMLSHSENSDLNKTKCELCPFKAISKRRVANHWLVTHKNEKSKCTICDTFVLARLKEKHLLKCKIKKNVLECKECQFKTIHERIFVRHQMKCSNKRHPISRQSKTPGDQDGKLEKSEQRKKIKERSDHLRRCEYCSYSTNYCGNLQKHLLAHTVFNRPVSRCSKCDYKSTEQNLTLHMMMTHKMKLKVCSLSAANTKGLKKCDFCSYTTTQRGNLKNHRRQLHLVRNEPIVSCTKCDYKAPRVTLLFHYKNAHGSLMNEKEKARRVCTQRRKN